MRSFPVFCLILLVLGLSACDSDGGPDGSEVDGLYVATRYTFVQERGTLIGSIDVLDYAERRGGQPVFTLDLFGSDERFTLIYQLEGDDARSNASGSFDTESGDRVVVSFGDDNPVAQRVLLPGRLTFTTSEDRSTLTASASTVVSFEQLARLDPDRFGGLESGEVRGRLEIELARR
jgi:hypothetical protein